VVLDADCTEQQLKSALERRLASYAGKPVDVIVRTAREMTQVLRPTPFPNLRATALLPSFSMKHHLQTR
jgi:uncharacterized protein (DUF1697 family)